MKILFIGDYPNIVEPVRNVFFQQLIRRMAEFGVECSVIAPIPLRGKKSFSVPDEYDDITSNGAKIKVYYPKYVSYSAYKIGKFNTATLSEIAFRSAVWRVVKKIPMEYDAVYGHFVLHGGLCAVEISDKYDIPAFFACGESDIRDDIFAKYPLRCTKKISRCAGVISVSTKNAKDLLEYALVNEDQLVIAPNAIDTHMFQCGDKARAREKLGLPKDAFIAAFAGYFIERKGDKRVLEAAKNIPEIKLAFAGKGDNPPKGENVVFCSALVHEDMPLLYQAADVFVLPTLAEGCCNSIVEAMACGLPIISSDRAFNDDILTEDNSIRIDPTSVPEIREAMRTLYSDSKMRERLSLGALEMAKSLTIDNRTERILQFIIEKKDSWNSKNKKQAGG